MGLFDAIKRSVLSRVIGVVVLVVVSGIVVGGKALLATFGPHPQAVAVVAVPVPHPNPPAVAAPVAQVVAATPTPANAKTKAKADPKQSAISPNRPGTPAQPVVNDGTGAPMVTAVPQPAQQPGSNLAHLDDHLTYQYNALGRRDPFQSLVEGAFVGADVGGDAPPDPGGIKVVGIVWGATDQFALVEDNRGNSFVLRKGDKVQNGYVEGLKRDGVIVNITAEGQSQSVVIPLVRKGEQNAR